MVPEIKYRIVFRMTWLTFCGFGECAKMVFCDQSILVSTINDHSGGSDVESYV